MSKHVEYSADELRAFWKSLNDQREMLIAHGIPSDDQRCLAMRRLAIKVQVDLVARGEQTLFTVEPTHWGLVAAEIKV